MRGGDGLHSGSAWDRGSRSNAGTAKIGDACRPCLAEAIRKFEASHGRILAVCEELEQLADGLPALPTNGSHLRLARRVGAVLRDTHALEEVEILPVLASALGDEAVRDSVETLTEEHRTDEAFADEVCEVLMEWVAGERHHDAATLGYMLRGLFDNLRRHTARERDQLIAPAGRSLKDDRVRSDR